MSTDINTNIKTSVVRLSYASLITPKAAKEGQEKKYSCVLILDKVENADTITEMKSIISALTTPIKAANKGKLPAGFRIPLKDGDKPGEDGEGNPVEPKPEYAGAFYINAGNKNKPQIKDRTKRDLTTDEEVYSGMYAKVVGRFFAYNNDGRGISFSLDSVLKWKDGDKFGGGKVDILDAFDESDFDGGAEDDDLFS